MTVVGLAVLVRNHAHDGFSFHFRLERTTHTAVCASGGFVVFSLTQLDHALFHQRCGRADLHARTTGNTLGIHEVFVLAGRNTRSKATAIDRQREGALSFLTGTHAAVTYDA